MGANDMPTRFPSFEGWRRYKIFFLNNMSLRQKDDNTREVVVTEEMQARFSNCPLCSERFSMSYNIEVEDWVYANCRMLGEEPFHFPLCWDYAKKQ